MYSLRSMLCKQSQKDEMSFGVYEEGDRSEEVFLFCRKRTSDKTAIMALKIRNAESLLPQAAWVAKTCVEMKKSYYERKLKIFER